MPSRFQDENIELAFRLLNHRKSISDREAENWLQQASNRKLLDELAGVKRSLEERNFEKDKTAEWLRLQRKISYSQNRRRLTRISIAATIILLFGLGIWFGQEKKHTLPNRLPVAEILPGKIQAQLILSEGKSIELKSTTTRIQTSQVSGLVNDSLQGLNYTQVVVSTKQIQPVYHTLKVPIGGFYRLELPDGSKVWLNAASELKFPVPFTGSKREVYLKGEGYFQVSRDSSRQFVVHLKNSSVTVLGTAFNINAYEEEDCIYTTLVEGTVAFKSSFTRQQVILHPGMQSQMEVKTGRTSMAQVDVSIYTAWIDGRFIFRSTDLASILRQLQRWYDFEVFYQQPDIKQYEFRGAVSRDMPIRKVLNIIEETTDLKFEINGKTIIVNQ